MANEKEMIKPFIEKQIGGKNISYGLSSFGYDARVSNGFKIFTDVDSAIVDPKNFKNNSFVSRTGSECIIPPNSFALASTVEYFKIPKDILVICLGKSTYARCGIIVNVTPLEPGWEGHVTLKQITKISFGILKYSTVLASAKEFGGIIHSLPVLETKLLFLKFFGSTIAESTSVKILNPLETLAS
jgi:deoxycytidine triphosphate deaminase